MCRNLQPEYGRKHHIFLTDFPCPSTEQQPTSLLRRRDQRQHTSAGLRSNPPTCPAWNTSVPVSCWLSALDAPWCLYRLARRERTKQIYVWFPLLPAESPPPSPTHVWCLMGQISPHNIRSLVRLKLVKVDPALLDRNTKVGQWNFPSKHSFLLKKVKTLTHLSLNFCDFYVLRLLLMLISCLYFLSLDTGHRLFKCNKYNLLRISVIMYG